MLPQFTMGIKINKNSGELSNMKYIFHTLHHNHFDIGAILYLNFKGK